MPMVYADEEIAATIMGESDFSQPYAQVMGVGIRWMPRRRRRLLHARPALHGHEDWFTEPSPQIGANIITSLLTSVGLKDPLSKYKEKGMSLAQIFARFNSAVDGYTQTVRQIPRGSVQSTLQKSLDGILRQRAALAPAFAAGARAGSKDEAALGTYVESVKSFRNALKKAVQTYGIRAVVADPESEEVAAASVAEVPQVGMPWLWLVPAGLFLYLVFKRK